MNWRNPRIHDASRVKIWLACDAHRESLEGYLSSRGFPTLLSAVDEAVDLVPDRA